MHRLSPLIILLLMSWFMNGQTMHVIDSLRTELERYSEASTKRVDILNDLGYNYWIVNSKESVIYGNKALELANELNYPKGAALAKRVLGVSYWTLGQLKLALENLTSGQEIYREIGDEEGAANCLMNTGMVYADIGDNERALDIYDRSIDQFTKLGLNRRIATTFTKIGSVLIQKNQLTQAKDYLINALNMHSEDNYNYGMAEAHNRLGILFLMQEELELADYHIKKSMELGETVNDLFGHISNLIQQGKLFRLRNNYEDSETLLQLALNRAKEKGLLKYQVDAFKELKLLKKQQGKLNESIQYYDSYIILRDSVHNTEKSRQIAAMEFTNEMREKEVEIALLREKERAGAIIRWSMCMGILFLLFIVLLIYRNAKQRTTKNQELMRRKQELLASKEELAKAALENAHFKQNELAQELEFRNKELTAYTLNFVQKNEFLQQLQDKVETAKNTTPSLQNKFLQELGRDIRHHINIDRDWEDFKRHFEEVHTDFYRKLKDKHPDLSANDLKLCSLVRLNLNVKEAAGVLGISPESAKTARYRLRKKLGLELSFWIIFCS